MGLLNVIEFIVTKAFNLQHLMSAGAATTPTPPRVPLATAQKSAAKASSSLSPPMPGPTRRYVKIESTLEVMHQTLNIFELDSTGVSDYWARLSWTCFATPGVW